MEEGCVRRDKYTAAEADWKWKRSNQPRRSMMMSDWCAAGAMRPPPLIKVVTPHGQWLSIASHFLFNEAFKASYASRFCSYGHPWSAGGLVFCTLEWIGARAGMDSAF